MQCPHAVMFDLDDTLAESFRSPSDEMVGALIQLAEYVPIAIITGRDFAWMERDFLPEIARSPYAGRFFILPEGSAQCYRWDGTKWNELYGETISDDERKQIVEAIKESVAETGVLNGLPVFGEQYLQKKAMIAFAALGLDVPRGPKYSWDPGNVRRAKLRAAIEKKLPEYDVVMGGATSIDVTKKGVNKARGVQWLARDLKITPPEMLYVGDALYEGGNDAVVISTGIQTRTVSDPEETLAIINDLITACAV